MMNEVEQYYTRPPKDDESMCGKYKRLKTRQNREFLTAFGMLATPPHTMILKPETISYKNLKPERHSKLLELTEQEMRDLNEEISYLSEEDRLRFVGTQKNSMLHHSTFRFAKI